MTRSRLPQGLHAAMPVHAAMPRVLQACVHAVRLAAARFENRQAVEDVHRLRVAIRRLRTALAVFRECLPARRLASMRRELRRLQRHLGIVRDWDILIGAALPAGLSEPEVLRRRARAARRSAAEFSSKRFRKLMRRLEADAAGEAVDAPGHGAGDEPRIGALADETLQRYCRCVEQRCNARPTDSRDLHALRIRAKKLRDVAEFFKDLYAAKPMQRLLTVLKRLQDRLGTLHDLERTQLLSADLRGAVPSRTMLVYVSAATFTRLKLAEQAVCAAMDVIKAGPRR